MVQKQRKNPDVSFEGSYDVQLGSRSPILGFIKSSLSVKEILVDQTYASLLQREVKSNHFLSLLPFYCSILDKIASRHEQ